MVCYICYMSSFVKNWNFLFRIGCSFLDIPFCVIKIGINTYAPIFEFVAEVILILICD